MTIDVLSSADWKEISEITHASVFGERRDPSLDRVDFALLVNEEEKPIAYSTCYEHDAETVYLQHGGALMSEHGYAGKTGLRAYRLILETLKGLGYKQAQTMIENTNQSMLHLAMRNGWLINGVKFHQGTVLVQHNLEFN